MLWADDVPQIPGSVLGIFHVGLIAGTRDSDNKSSHFGGPGVNVASRTLARILTSNLKTKNRGKS